MKIEILDDDLTKRVYDVADMKEGQEDILFISSADKESSVVSIFKTYKYSKKLVLFDESNQSIKELVNHIDLKDIDFSMLLFTSGSTGKPVGAFKTRENLENEVDELAKLIQKYRPKKVISTVPFVHIYGVLASVLLPYKLDIDLFFKKHFLPHDLLQSIEPNSVIVTTPLYIKALLRTKESMDLSRVVFISSTAPLDVQSASSFIKKFNTNLIQLFGSTETGGIAYKEQDDTLWKPLDSVKVVSDKSNLLKIKSPFVSKLLYEDGLKRTNGEIQSFDYVEFVDKRFKIIGRSSQIFKVSGKRFSSLHVEEILESMSGVDKAYVSVRYDKDNFKEESLEIYFESKQNISLKKIHSLLRQKIGNTKFPIRLQVVDKIPTTALEKKIIPI